MTLLLFINFSFSWYIAFSYLSSPNFPFLVLASLDDFFFFFFLHIFKVLFFEKIRKKKKGEVCILKAAKRKILSTWTMTEEDFFFFLNFCYYLFCVPERGKFLKLFSTSASNFFFPILERVESRYATLTPGAMLIYFFFKLFFKIIKNYFGLFFWIPITACYSAFQLMIPSAVSVCLRWLGNLCIILFYSFHLFF